VAHGGNNTITDLVQGVILMNAYQLQHLDKTNAEIRKDSEDLKEIKRKLLARKVRKNKKH
jgi:hypothetical protein